MDASTTIAPRKGSSWRSLGKVGHLPFQAEGYLRDRLFREMTSAFRRAARRACLHCGVHAHLFRHGYAINFLNCGGRLDALQKQLGHRDINTTPIYLRLTSEGVMRQVAKIQF